MPTNFITFPPGELYELVWSKPIRDVAADFGISDVALAGGYGAASATEPAVISQ